MVDGRTRAAGLRILIVDDEANIRITLSLCLEAEGHHVVAHGNIHEALTEASWQAFDLVFLDVRLGLDNGLDFLPQLLAENPWAKVVVITAYASIDSAVQAIKRGAADYLPKPFTPEQVLMVTEKVAAQRRLERKVDALQAALGEMDPDADLPTASASMQRSLDLARQVASSSASLLIRGELGTGKGRLARAIHVWSDRANAPFATVACETSSPDALEVELFGLSSRQAAESNSEPMGRVQFCDGGTLMLDEVGNLPPSLQPKLVRLLRDHEYERHDDFKVRQANVRVIATTSVDLQALVNKGRFRPELLLALDVVKIDIPPLRQRPEDVKLLANRYLAFFGKQNHRRIGGFTPDAMVALVKHYWPGNLRELRNIIERAVIVCKSGEVGLEHLPPNLLNSPSAYSVGDLVPLDTIEEQHIRRVVASTRSIGRAASILGIHPGTVLRRLRRYEIAPNSPDHGRQTTPATSADDQPSN